MQGQVPVAAASAFPGRAVFLMGVLTALGFAAPSSPPAPAAVTNLDDSGPGSLRQAIAGAVPGETITFGVSGKIVLTSGELVIDKDLNIDGPGSELLRISGNDSSRVMTIDPGVTVNIVGVTIRDGFLLSGSGAGILNHGTLALLNCAILHNQIHSFSSTGGGGIANTGSVTGVACLISGNIAHIVLDGGGGILNGGALDLSNSVVSNNSVELDGSGGGILNTGSVDLSTCVISNNTAGDSGTGGGLLNRAGALLTLSHSLVSGNYAVEGGGVYNLGTLTGADCTLSLNTGVDYGGGISNGGDADLSGCTLSSNTATFWGGGIVNWGTGLASMTMTNCTISGNVADLGGGLSNFDLMTISNTTVTANAFGIENLGPFNVKNSIVAGNLYQDCIEPVTTGTGTNYDSDGTCGPGFTQITTAQLQIAALANNGGPTWTHALLPGSVAIDQAVDCTDFFGNPVRADQRGVPRPQGMACDVGAFERGNDGPPASPLSLGR